MPTLSRAPRRFHDWTGPALLGAIAAGTLAYGFVLAMGGRYGERLGPPPAAAVQRQRAGTFHVVALGDSITHGTGDAADRGPAIGYVGRVVEALRRRGLTVTLTNLAVPGDETGDLLRRLTPQALERVRDARLILVSAGGNDLSHTLRGAGDDARDEPEAALAKAQERLREIVARLRGVNPTAPVRLVGLYNPFEVLAGHEAEARAQLLAWNHALEQATLPFQGVLVVPVADAFVDRPDRLAGDRFHPGPRGHEVIAQRVLSTLAESDPR